MTKQEDSQLEISTDRSRLDRDLIHRFLAESYWAEEIPRTVVDRSIDHSLCFGAYLGSQQIGFARVISDHATFAYLADVFVLPEYRGQGFAQRMLEVILAHPDLQRLRRSMLATRDAHSLYAKFGFEALAEPDKYMTIHRPDLYKMGP